MTPSLKTLTEEFLTMIVGGKIQEAYDMYVAADFIHHNQYSKRDRESLQKAMTEHHEQFPNKEMHIIKMIAENDTVISYSKVTLSTDLQIKVVHIIKFRGDKIVEMWDIGEKLDVNAVNEDPIG